MTVFDAIWPATSKGPWLRHEMMVVVHNWTAARLFETPWHSEQPGTEPHTVGWKAVVMWHMTHRWVGRWVGGLSKSRGLGDWASLSIWVVPRDTHKKPWDNWRERHSQRGWPGVTRTTLHSNWSGATLTHTSCVHFGWPSERRGGWAAGMEGDTATVSRNITVSPGTRPAPVWPLCNPPTVFLPHLTRFFFLVETKKAAMRHLLTALVAPTTNYSREMRDTHHPIPVRHLWYYNLYHGRRHLHLVATATYSIRTILRPHAKIPSSSLTYHVDL